MRTPSWCARRSPATPNGPSCSTGCGTAQGHPGWFQPDGLHLTTSGALAFTHLLARVVRLNYPRKQTRSNLRERPGGALGQPRHPGATPPTPSTLQLTTSLHHAGRVAVTLAGPVGGSVQVSELRDGRAQTLATVSLQGSSATGTAQLPSALTWRCDLRRRTLQAVLLGPSPQTATAAVQTPSCAGRFVGIDRRPVPRGRAAEDPPTRPVGSRRCAGAVLSRSPRRCHHAAPSARCTARSGH